MNVIIIPGVNKNIVVAAEQIIRIEAVSNYSRIHLADGKKIVVAKVLRWFQESLPADMFVRVHRSHLVNKLFVKEVRGEMTKKLLLNSGEYILVSRRKKSLLESIKILGKMVA